MRPAFAFLALLPLAACGSSSDRPPLPVAKGEWRVMNADKWDAGGNAVLPHPPGVAEAMAASRGAPR